MRSMHSVFFLVFFLSFNTLQSQTNFKLEEDFYWLFGPDQKSGWHLVIDDKGVEENLFDFENGIIHAYKTQKEGSTQSFAGVVTDTAYSAFILKFEYKWGEKKFNPRADFVRDAGVIFHMHGEEMIWPNGAKIQIQEGDTGDLWGIGVQLTSRVNSTIENYDPEGALILKGNKSKRFSRFHRAYSWEKSGWNEVEIKVSRDQALFYVNGHLVNEALGIKYWNQQSEAYEPLESGNILFQAEGAEILYRRIRIKNLQ